MSIDFKDIAKLSIEIYKLLDLPFDNIIGLAGAAFLPDDDDDEQELKDWRASKAIDWMAWYEELMGIPMQPELKRQTAMGKLRADFYKKYGEIPKERYVEKLHSDLVLAVKGDIAGRLE